MCGICGWINQRGVDTQSLIRMNREAAHRGPDGEGYWIKGRDSDTGRFVSSQIIKSEQAQNAAIGFGHRRLAILDLSDSGLQPMASRDQKTWIVFNGEIYNCIELRKELQEKGHKFVTGTDTEVIISAYTEWGTECFARFNGMWGLVIADLRKNRIVLSRDRLGIKPLYLWCKHGEFAFSSEIKQLLMLPSINAEANMDAIAEYIDTGYEVPPNTFFKDIMAFEPGTFGVVDINNPEIPKCVSFWFPEKLSPLSRGIEDAALEVNEIFKDSVKLRLRSDVPVGVSLSGGLDSSAIYGQVQLLKKNDDTHAFSAAFDDPRFDESPFIGTVLKKFGGKAHNTFPVPDDFLIDFDDFIYKHDEPPGGLSQYAAWCVMRLARKNKVPVILNGQGGDELFTGYWSAYYIFLSQMARRKPWKMVPHILGALLPSGNCQLLTQVLPHYKQFQHRKQRNNRALFQGSWKDRGYTLNNNWAVQAQQLSPVEYKLKEIRWIHLPRLLKWDDRNSMASSIEGRYPLLDHRLVEFAVKISSEQNLHRGWNKYLLRKGLANTLPSKVLWRKTKVGFETPQSEWIRTTLRNPLKEWSSTPSSRLLQIIDKKSFVDFATTTMNKKKLHKMDEDHIYLMRLYFLDKWLEKFQVAIQ